MKEIGIAGKTEILSRGISIRGYYLSIALFFISVGLFLFTLVEMRRGIFLPLNEYVKIGVPSAILYINLRHIPLLLVGILGAWLSYKYMAGHEANIKSKVVHVKKLRNLLAFFIMVFLVVDLFTYRGVPASRTISAGKIGVGQAFSLDGLPIWLRPLGEAVNYFALVWHATLLGILIGALLLVLVAAFLKPALGGKGFKSHIAGALLAIPYPFCSCCAAPIGATLFRSGASVGPTLAFVVSAPMLNLTSLILAASLLPTNFATLRIAGGLVVAVVVTYLVSMMSAKWLMARPASAPPNRALELSSKIIYGYSRLFRFEDFIQGRPADSPATFIATWLGMAWSLGRVVVPVLFIGAIVAAAIVYVLPPASNSITGVIVASIFGTLLMIPTWTEIAIAGPLIQQGIAGPAAALLLTLPAVSIPCLIIIGGALNNHRIGLLLGLSIFVVGVVVGFAFL